MNYTNYRVNDIYSTISKRHLLTPIDVLLVGATGTGKSSTLNAIFGSEVAKVGKGTDPETQIISGYKVHNYLRIHDSAGLGDGKLNDLKHSEAIIQTLKKLAVVNGERTNYGFIDLVIVILDGSSRDLGTAFDLLKNAVVPNIESDRIMVAINQADMAMRGKYWNSIYKHPETQLYDFLEKQAYSVQHRIMETNKVMIDLPICYSAYYQWNIDKFVDKIIEHIPHRIRELKDYFWWF